MSDLLARIDDAARAPTLLVACDFDGAIAPIAGPLFNEYLLAFEVTSVLLLADVVGAVVSTTHVAETGDASVLPAGSVARTASGGFFRISAASSSAFGIISSSGTQ